MNNIQDILEFCRQDHIDQLNEATEQAIAEEAMTMLKHVDPELVDMIYTNEAYVALTEAQIESMSDIDNVVSKISLKAHASAVYAKVFKFLCKIAAMGTDKLENFKNTTLNSSLALIASFGASINANMIKVIDKIAVHFGKKSIEKIVISKDSADEKKAALKSMLADANAVKSKVNEDSAKGFDDIIDSIENKQDQVESLVMGSNAHSIWGAGS